MIGLLVGYMWLFIHRPFEIWTALATYRIERMYMIGTIAFWFASGARVPVGNRVQRYLACFVLVMVVSWCVSPFQHPRSDETVENYLKYAVFYVLLVTSVRDVRDLRTILVGHFCIITLLMTHSLLEYFNGRRHYAQGIVRLVPVGSSYDYNDLAGIIVSSQPLVWVLWHAWNEWWKRAALLAQTGLACVCVMLTGSRMGFIGMVLASMLACLTSTRRWQLLCLFPLLLAAVWMILPQDRRDRYLTLVDPSRGPSDAAASAGNLRFGGFAGALPLFAERPLLGCGPNNYRLASGMPTMPHNLYGQLLAELGVAGAITFFLMLVGVAQNALDARRIVRTTMTADDLLPWHTVLAASASFLLLAIMAWGFNFLFWHVWLWFGGFQVVALRLLSEHATFRQWNNDELSAHTVVGDPAWE
jgi:hypothetical protein